VAKLSTKKDDLSQLARDCDMELVGPEQLVFSLVARMPIRESSVSFRRPLTDCAADWHEFFVIASKHLLLTACDVPGKGSWCAACPSG